MHESLRQVHCVSVALVCATLTACPPSYEVSIYNNSGHDVTVALEHRRIPWKADSSLAISGNGEISWGTLPVLNLSDDRRVRALVLEAPGETLRYAMAYNSFRGGNTKDVLQLNSDWNIYLVGAGRTLPATSALEREGFPIVPLQR